MTCAHFLFHILESVQIVNVPGHFSFAHPEGFYFYLVLGTFVGSAAFFAGRAAHREFTAGDRDHVVHLRATSDFLRITFKITVLRYYFKTKKNG
ncbi:hypothetical protein D3C87_1783580 [compost metagenome]